MNTRVTILPHKGSLSDLALQKGVKNLDGLLIFLRALPYGRTSSREDLSLVLSCHIGTCSTKHALIQPIAQEQKWPGIDLVLVMYK